MSDGIGRRLVEAFWNYEQSLDRQSTASGKDFEAGWNAAADDIKTQLEPSPCGVKGHCLRDMVFPVENSGPRFEPYCLRCREIQAACDLERQRCIKAINHLREPKNTWETYVEAIRSLGTSTALSDAVREATHEALVEASKSMCFWCREGNPVQEFNDVITANGRPYWHKVDLNYIICDAAPIQRLAQLRGGTK